VTNFGKFIRAGAVVLGLSLMAAAAPIAAQTPAEQTTTREVDDDGFDEWGLLGLLGLAGLLGRKRADRDHVVEGRRV
jgi:MYXO-CTERM domain-containing protein